MKDWTQGRIERDGVSLRYFRSGGDLPPLVLVHGFTDNALYFTRVADVLAETWDVVAYDVRGHGASDRLAGRPFDDATRVADLAHVVATLGLDRPAMLGHSLGGATIALAVAGKPTLSRGVVLEDPAWFEPASDLTDEQLAKHWAERSERNRTWRESIVAVQAGTREQGLAWRRADSPLWTDEDISLSLDARMQVDIEVFDYYPQRRSPWKGLVAQFACPGLVVFGDKERGGIISSAQAAEAHAINPLVSGAHIAGAGHAVRYDQTEAFLGAVGPFLASLLR